jgi:hypothetical protein
MSLKSIGAAGWKLTGYKRPSRRLWAEPHARNNALEREEKFK